MASTQNAPKAVPTIRLDLIDKVLKRDAKAGLLVEGIFLEAGVRDAENVKKACKNAGRCANGALLLAAGYDPRRLATEQAEERVRLDPGTKAGQLLKDTYGLLRIHTAAIIEVNDGVCDNNTQQLDRYDSVMALLTFAEVMQQNGVRFASEFQLRRSHDDGFEDTDVSSDDIDF